MSLLPMGTQPPVSPMHACKKQVSPDLAKHAAESAWLILTFKFG